AGALDAERLQLGDTGRPGTLVDVDRRVERLHEAPHRVRIAQADRIEAIGAGGEIGPAARHCRVEAALPVADILDVEVGAGVDHDRHAGGASGLARGADAGGGVRHAADRRAPRLQTVFEVHADRAGRNDVADRAADRLGRRAIAGLDIGGY